MELALFLDHTFKMFVLFLIFISTVSAIALLVILRYLVVGGD